MNEYDYIKNFVIKIINYEFPEINIKNDNIYCKLKKTENSDIYKLFVLNYSNSKLNEIILEIKKQLINNNINDNIYKFLLYKTCYIYDEFIDIKFIKISI
jgi:hypothetical protein